MDALGISVASMTLATLANPLIRSKIVSIENAKEDLEKLERSLETIKGALLNAEKFEEEPTVKDWIKRVKDVLYDADDLLDETAIDDELKKLNEVRDSPSTLNISFAGMIKDISNGKIFQSIFRSKGDNLNLEQRIAAIQERISGKKFLIVLDDVWDDSRDKWDARMGIFGRGAKGSKVIVTTRSYSVSDAVGPTGLHHLRGLSEEKSWDLFKRVARITPGKERDSRWNDLGREFARKGANVPLAIRSIASLLAEKNTIEEWELLRNVKLPKLGQNQENGIMPVLRLSYNHLSTNLKPCFAYCSLFPKGHRFHKEDLVHLWASQGYIKTTHDSQSIEHMDDSWADSLDVNKLRSILCLYRLSSPLTLEKQFANLKCLRALKLLWIGIKVVPSSIGELKHLRYLDISHNKIKTLPDDITKLVNLCTLNISKCGELEALPSQFRKLTNLRSLINGGCKRLKYMPPGIEELTSLQRLDEFRVSGKIGGVQTSKLDVLSGLKLTEEFRIQFQDETNDWDGVECWQPPLTLDALRIDDYQGLRIPHWGNGSTVNQASLLPKLTALTLFGCKRLKGWWIVAAASASTWALPSLQNLRIHYCPQLIDTLLYPNLIFWNSVIQLFRGNSIQPSSLQDVKLEYCLDLVSFPGESLTSLRRLCIEGCIKLNKVQLAPLGSNILEELELWEENKRGVDWDSLPKLTTLTLEEVPSSEKLPYSLRRRQECGVFKIQCL
ncbi:hypothetical protein V2J09_005404 [Rumex salicifolius]